MKKSLRKLVAVVLTAAMAMSVGMPAFAATGNQDVIEPQDHVMDSKLELVDTQTKWVYNIVVPGQDPEGEIYPPGSQIVYLKTGGNPVSISFSFTAGPVSVNIDPGNVCGPGVAGARSIPVDTTAPCLLYVDKKVKCEQYALYERLLGTTGSWNFVGYRYKTSVTSTAYHVDPV